MRGYVGRRLRMETAAEWETATLMTLMLCCFLDSSFHGGNSFHDHETDTMSWWVDGKLMLKQLDQWCCLDQWSSNAMLTLCIYIYVYVYIYIYKAALSMYTYYIIIYIYNISLQSYIYICIYIYVYMSSKHSWRPFFLPRLGSQFFFENLAGLAGDSG